MLAYSAGHQHLIACCCCLYNPDYVVMFVDCEYEVVC